MITDKKEIDFMRILLDDVDQRRWEDRLIAGTLELTKIFHYLSAIKLLKMDAEEEIKFEGVNISELNDIRNKLDKLLSVNNDRI